MAQAHGRAKRFDNFPIVGGMHARDHQAKRVRAGVDRGEVNGLGESQRHREASAADGR